MSAIFDGYAEEHSEVCARGQRLEASALAAESGAAPSAKRRRREERGGAGPERTARAHRVGRMLLQLRQACCHPRVVRRTASGGGGAALPRGVASREATIVMSDEFEGAEAVCRLDVPLGMFLEMMMDAGLLN